MLLFCVKRDKIYAVPILFRTRRIFMKLSLANFPLEFFYDIDKDQLKMLEEIRDCGYT